MIAIGRLTKKQNAGALLIKSFLFLTLVLLPVVGCNSSLTTVGNPKGIQVDVQMTNDIDHPVSSGLSTATVEETPAGYIVGLRRLSLFRCDDICLGQSGQVVDAEDIINILPLNDDDLFVDQLIYNAGSFSYGTTDAIDTSLIEDEDVDSDDEGFYSGLQLRLDFVAVEAPAIGGEVTALTAGVDFELVFLCLNALGCSTLTDYTADYLSGLGDIGSTAGEKGGLGFID